MSTGTHDVATTVDAAPVAEEQARTGVVEITLFALVAPALDHQVALPGPGAVDQEIDPLSDHGSIPLGERRLLPDDGGQVAVEGELEVLDLDSTVERARDRRGFSPLRRCGSAWNRD